MVKPEIVGENLILHVEGMDKILALKSTLTVPLKHIVDVRMDEDIVHGWFHGIKLGANIPGVVTAGSFYWNGGWAFWDIHHPEAAVVIELSDETYKGLVIEVENPREFIRQIYEARKG